MYRLIKENVEREVNNLASLSLLQSQGYKLIKENKVEENTEFEEAEILEKNTELEEAESVEFEEVENTEFREIELVRNENVNFEENFNKIAEEIEAKKEAEILEEKPKKRGRKKGE